MTKTRGGAPQEYAGAEPEPELRFMNLKVIWSLFEAQRCTSKHPLRGFETRWKYILPGRDPNGTEGVDYVLGEQAVVNFENTMARKETLERLRATQAVEVARAVETADQASATPNRPSRVYVEVSSKELGIQVVRKKV
ncbi:hypothetical protein PC129_g18087 [Phytophthora cactorum]|uniref:Uncharacterized protein n=2 Tax=Phytophthora cactorum TaxID=29920 RepID=A0A8T1HG14_9STRA|nr:hypothetical protein Pcac1_g9239 [Phytophthora cactorum]KAG2909315.1 hypothetical protein PC117_g19700 [Phytophthora cactorum]KAG2987005.1 hypothetical protein PC118_g7519 [Phytophthora cactorum]KAG3210928.1 hypothetical protein PC129_g18087 [Phytophthora cactorum]